MNNFSRVLSDENTTIRQEGAHTAESEGLAPYLDEYIRPVNTNIAFKAN